MIVLSYAASVVMTILFFGCLLASLPSVKSSACWILRAIFHDVSIANIGTLELRLNFVLQLTLDAFGRVAYPKIFKDLKPEHLRVAREHLSKPPQRMTSHDPRQVRVFNLDAAKLL